MVGLNSRIVVEGNDGTGKTTLISLMRTFGFTNVHDRGEMSAATLGHPIPPAANTTYILLVCPWEESQRRLQSAGKDMTEIWHTASALEKYDREFRQIAEQFDALVVDTSTTKNPYATLCEVLLRLKINIRVGSASGRLSQVKACEEWGFPFYSMGSDLQRTLYDLVPPFAVVTARSKNYPQMVALGLLDVAVVGEDALEGNPYATQIEVIQKAPQKNRLTDETMKVCFASKTGEMPQGDLLKVATPFPEWASKILGERGIPHVIFAVGGKSEALVAAGMMDVLFDVVESGFTLRANGLEIIEEVSALHVCLIRQR